MCYFSNFISGKMIVSAKIEDISNEDKIETAILYSTPQSMAEDLGCMTMTYFGKNVHLQVFITQGTIYTNNTPVFEQREIDSTTFGLASFQTPAKIPYMVQNYQLFPAM